jgi:hypothetical protein
VWLIWRTAWCALSTVSMKGRRTRRGTNSNWARMALPKVSAVMPVPSEMKNTVRECMKGAFQDVSLSPVRQAYNCDNYPILTMHPSANNHNDKAAARAWPLACLLPSGGRADPVFQTSGALPCLHCFQPDRPGRTV